MDAQQGELRGICTRPYWAIPTIDTRRADTVTLIKDSQKIEIG